MSPENFEALITAHLNRRPFQVFTIELQTGKRFEVDHPRAMVIRDGMAIFIAPGKVPIWFDHDSVNHISDSIANHSD